MPIARIAVGLPGIVSIGTWAGAVAIAVAVTQRPVSLLSQRSAILELTERQAQTLRWVALGESAAAAAARMDIAPRTADKHLQHVYAKLGVSTQAEASTTTWAQSAWTLAEHSTSQGRVSVR